MLVLIYSNGWNFDLLNQEQTVASASRTWWFSWNDKFSVGKTLKVFFNHPLEISFASQIFTAFSVRKSFLSASDKKWVKIDYSFKSLHQNLFESRGKTRPNCFIKIDVQGKQLSPKIPKNNIKWVIVLGNVRFVTVFFNIFQTCYERRWSSNIIFIAIPRTKAFLQVILVLLISFWIGTSLNASRKRFFSLNLMIIISSCKHSRGFESVRPENKVQLYNFTHWTNISWTT